MTNTNQINTSRHLQKHELQKEEKLNKNKKRKHEKKKKNQSTLTASYVGKHFYKPTNITWIYIWQSMKK